MDNTKEVNESKQEIDPNLFDNDIPLDHKEEEMNYTDIPNGMEETKNEEKK